MIEIGEKYLDLYALPIVFGKLRKVVKRVYLRCVLCSVCVSEILESMHFTRAVHLEDLSRS